MTVQTQVGSFNVSTGTAGYNIVITGVGFQPAFVIFWWNGRDSQGADTIGAADHMRGMGFGISSTNQGTRINHSRDNQATTVTDNRSATGTVILSILPAGTIDGSATLTSLDSDGFTVNVGKQFTINMRVHYWAVGGTDITNVMIGNFASATATGNFTITGVGFQPDIVFFAGGNNINNPPNTASDSSGCLGVAMSTGNYVWMGGSDNAAAATSSRSYAFKGECIGRLSANVTTTVDRCSFVSMVSDGFTLNKLDGNTAITQHYLAIKGGNWTVGDIQTQTGTAIDITINPGHASAGGLFISHGLAQNTQDTPNNDDRLSIGAFSSTGSQRACGTFDLNAADPTQVTTAIEHDNVYVNIKSDRTIDGTMAVTQVTSSAIKLQMTDADPTPAFVWFVTVGNPSATNYNQAIDATSTLSPLVSKGVGKLIVSTSTLTPAFAETVAYLRTLAATSTLSPVINKLVAYFKSLDAISTLTATVNKGLAKTLAVSSTFTAALAKARGYLINLAATSTLSPTITGTVSIAETNVLHIAPQPKGSDVTGNGTIAAPYFSAAKAHAAAVTGTTIYYHGGIYYPTGQWTLSKDGGEFAYITHKPYTSGGVTETPIFDGSSGTFAPAPSPDSILKISGNYIAVDGLNTFVARNNTLGRGISVSAASGTFIKNLVVHDVGERGIGGSGMKITIQNCEVYNASYVYAFPTGSSGWAQGIAPFTFGDNSLSRDWVITGCHVHDNWGEGVIALRCTGIVVIGCIIHDNYSVGLYCDKAMGVTFDSNYIFYSNTQYNKAGAKMRGINTAVESNSPVAPNTDVLIRNNVIAGCSVGWRYFRSSSNNNASNKYDNVRFDYNTIYGCDSYAVDLDETFTGTVVPTNCFMRNNILFSGTVDGQGLRIGARDRNAWTFQNNLYYFDPPSYATGTNSIIKVNPNLVNPVVSGAVTGFNPMTGSIVRAAGLPIAETGFDYYHSTRSATLPTIGFYEFPAANAFNQALNVIMTFSPAVANTAAYLRTLAVTATMSVGRSNLVAYLRSLVATSTVSPTITKGVGKPINATSTLTPIILKNVGKLINSTSTFTAAINRNVGKLINATSTFTATISKLSAYFRNLDVSSTFTVSMARLSAYFKTLGVSVLMTPLVLKAMTKTLQATSTFTATLNKGFSVLKTLAVSMTVTPNILKNVGKNINATSTLTPAINKTVAYLKTLAATSTLTVGFGRGIAKTLSAISSFTAGLAQGNVNYLRTLAVTVTFNPAIQRGIGLAVNATSALSVGFNRQISKAIAATSTLTANVNKNVGKLISATSTFTGNLAKTAAHLVRLDAQTTINILLSKQAAYLRNLNATTTLTPTVSKLGTYFKTLAVNVSFTVAMVKGYGYFITLAATSTLTATLSKVYNQYVPPLLTMGNKIRRWIRWLRWERW